MRNMIQELQSWLTDSVEKQADAGSENTSHTSKSVDNQAAPAQTGSRSSENESDVKSQIPGQSVDDASANEAEGAGRGENSPVHSIGVESEATGEAPALETEGVKAHPSDPGTSHPAKADTGEKYSSLIDAGNSILADIAVAQATGTVEATDKSAAAAVETPAVEVEAPVEDKEASDKTLEEARDAGANAAKLIAKAAGLEEVGPTREQVVSQIVKSAEYDAILACDFLDGYKKSASETELPEGDAQLSEGSETSDDDDVPSPEAAPVEVPEAPIDPLALEGGKAPAGDEAALIEEMAAALVEQGITPEDILSGGIGGEVPGGEGLEAAAPGAVAGDEAAALEALIGSGDPKMASVKMSREQRLVKIAGIKAALLIRAQKKS